MSQVQRFIYSISQLSNEAKELLEGTFPLIWVEGEISNLSRPSSGHWYFSLKDSQSQMRCAMFRMRNMHIRFNPKNGDQVLIRTRVSLYTPRGDFQLIAEHMEEAGDGVLLRNFEELKQKLNQQGLFSPEHKKALPQHPKHIGLITSPSGAAIRDILQVLNRRAPWIPVTLYPAAVQGEQAADELINMIHQATTDKRCDLLIIGRGGGSIEDLNAFNSEPLAHAIHLCPIPIISAVGHEIDYTISDFAADLRAPTPSAAAEIATPDQAQWIKQIQQFRERLSRASHTLIKQKQQQLASLTPRMRHPQQRLLEQSQQLDELERRLLSQYQQQHRQRQYQLAALHSSVVRNSPQHRLALYSSRLLQLNQRLHKARERLSHDQQQRLQQLAHQLNTVSPLATLSRGYAIARVRSNNELLRDTKQLTAGDEITLTLQSGELTAQVKECNDD